MFVYSRTSASCFFVPLSLGWCGLGDCLGEAESERLEFLDLYNQQECWIVVFKVLEFIFVVRRRLQQLYQQI